MQTEDPTDALADVEALKTRTSRALSADGWQWMLVWSLVALGAGLTALVDALAATVLVERRSKDQRAVRRDKRPHVAVGR